jgi:S1-C subfamily serine protease
MAGDIIVRIGEHAVADLQAMTVALRSYKPGESAEIVVRRDEQTVTTQATFGSRD